MANLVNLESVSKSYGVKPLLDGVSLGVAAGQRIGVVGLNGGGKTTLLEVLSGLAEPDSGRVSHVGGLRMAVVTQRTELPDGSSVGEVVLERYGAEHEWAADARVRSIVDGLGITAIGLDTPTANLSGGERRRVSLAAALTGELDLVVLDEPTNHLDVEGVQWLADHLLTRRTPAGPRPRPAGAGRGVGRRGGRVQPAEPSATRRSRVRSVCSASTRASQ